MTIFRGQIYVDVFVNDKGTLEEQREKAYFVLKKHANKISNAFTSKATLQTNQEMWNR